jgi:cystathionine beta-lyase
MKDYNFDELIDRTNTNCIKYDARKQFFGSEDVLPLWVADMDFKTPDFIIEALKKRLEHEVLGYTFRDGAYFGSIINWLDKRHGWKVEKEWISFSPGVVAGLTLAIEAYSMCSPRCIFRFLILLKAPAGKWSKTH